MSKRWINPGPSSAIVACGAYSSTTSRPATISRHARSAPGGGLTCAEIGKLVSLGTALTTTGAGGGAGVFDGRTAP
jgi:hypothetical protein